MRAGNIDRVKRRLLAEAVADNLDTIRGLPPRALRKERRWGRVAVRAASFLLVPAGLAGATWLSLAGGEPSASPLPQAVAQVIPVRGSILGSTPRPPAAPPSTERVTSAAFPLAVRRVVLDAGHGGSDPGATAASLHEKEITLDVGHRLRGLLEASGFEVVVTRPDDRTVALSERAKLANESKSDIFISIHVNTIIKHTASRGIETYYLGATSDPSLTELAAAENRVSGYSISDMRKLLDGVYADARRDESQQLATHIQQKLYGTLRTSDPGLEDWGVKRAPFLVLVATDMPAILAEVGCMSNPKEAEMLGRPEYRQKIAQALFEGIRSYASANG
ncbi:MAG TPA: N-acetylmuramoyl-L-alanine amidase [Thermoanaerobaculia bacterium]